MSETCNCPSCGAAGATVSIRQQEFDYRVRGHDTVTLTVRLPVMICEACREMFTDWRADEIRDAAVRADRLRRGL